MSRNTEISDRSMFIFAALIILLFAFLIVTSIQNQRRKKRPTRIQIYYVGLCISFIIWCFSMIMMGFTPNDGLHLREMQIWDAVSNIGTDFSPVFMFFIALSFVSGEKKFSKWINVLFFIPLFTVCMVFSNDYHHLIYKFHEGISFSIIRKDFELGPILIFKGVLSYLYLLGSIVILFWYSVKKQEKLIWKQSSALMIGALSPLFVSILATAGSNLGITATPLSFTVLIVCNYIAIFRLDILNIVPFATSKVLDIIPDGFLILNSDNLILESNAAFCRGPGKILELRKNDVLDESFISSHRKNGGVLYTLLSALNSCNTRNKQMSYEQAMYLENEEQEETVACTFMVDIQVIEISTHYYGHIVVFRDITQLKQSLVKIQESRERMMEQERLAMLGQMVGGMAHNLKTPIMSIAGGTSSIETLLQEVLDSLGDDDVTDDDYREIIGDITQWIKRIRESCSYMSEMINAVKGQAANATNSENKQFSLEDVVKDSELLMRHELKNANLKMTVEKSIQGQVILEGDMNSLIQVLNNLISNAIFASKNAEKREIVVSVHQKEDSVDLSVRDHGPGIAPEVQKKLFREMVTTKGAKGTGLGLFISASIIRGKFGGTMWYKDAEEGGAILGMSMPLVKSASEV